MLALILTLTITRSQIDRQPNFGACHIIFVFPLAVEPTIAESTKSDSTRFVEYWGIHPLRPLGLLWET